MNIIEQAAIALQEIDAELALAEKATVGPWTLGKGVKTIREQGKAGPYGFVARTHLAGEFCPRNDKEKNDNASFIAAARTVCPTALRCLKTAIEGLLEIYKYDSGNGCCDYGCDTPTIAENLLTTLINQWNSK